MNMIITVFNNFIMRYILFLIILSVCLYSRSPLLGQVNNRTEMPTLTHRIWNQQDTNTVISLIDTVRKLKHKKRDSTIALINKAVAISHQLNYKTGIVRAHYELADYLFEKQNYDSSQKVFFYIQSYCARNPGLLIADQALEARLYCDIANTYVLKGPADSALFYYTKSIQTFKRNNYKNNHLRSWIATNFGSFLANYGYSPQGLFYVKTGLQLSLQLKDTFFSAMNLNNLGLLYIDAAKMHKEPKYIDSALFFLNKALVWYKYYMEKGYRIPDTYSGIAWAKIEFGDLDGAKVYFDSALMYAYLYPEGKTDPAIDWGIGQIYMSRKDYKNALKSLQHSLYLYNIRSDLKLKQAWLYKDIAHCYHYLNNSDSAFKYLSLYDKLRDSTINTEIITAVNNTEVKYRTTEKEKDLAEKEILLAQKSNEVKSRNLMLLAIGSGSITIIAFLFGIYKNNKQKQKLQEEKIKTLEAQEKNKMLQANMEGIERERGRIAQELHDGIGGMLAAVKMNFSILEQKHGLQDSLYYKETLSLISDTASEVRKTAHNLMPGFLAEQNLEAALSRHCDQINSRQQKLTLTFQAYGMNRPLNDELKRTIFLVIQELIQNILKHAEATRALVQLGMQDEFLHILVEDDGKGLVPGWDQFKTGMGLSTLQKRVQEYGGCCTITTLKGEGTTIDLEFELNNKEKKMTNAL